MSDPAILKVQVTLNYRTASTNFRPSRPFTAETFPCNSRAIETTLGIDPLFPNAMQKLSIDPDAVIELTNLRLNGTRITDDLHYILVLLPSFTSNEVTISYRVTIVPPGGSKRASGIWGSVKSTLSRLSGGSSQSSQPGTQGGEGERKLRIRASGGIVKETDGKKVRRRRVRNSEPDNYEVMVIINFASPSHRPTEFNAAESLDLNAIPDTLEDFFLSPWMDAAFRQSSMEGDVTVNDFQLTKLMLDGEDVKDTPGYLSAIDNIRNKDTGSSRKYFTIEMWVKVRPKGNTKKKGSKRAQGNPLAFS